MPPLLQLREVRFAISGSPLLDGAELSISPGDRIAIVGRNGSGKSTLLRIAAGHLTADQGELFVQPGCRLQYLPQEPDLSGHATTGHYVLSGLDDEDQAYRAHAFMEELGVDETAAPESLSGGEARRAALSRVLAAEPDILLLDEPTNHLDLVAIEWLEAWLKSSRIAFALISHDRRLLRDLTTSTIWLDRGSTHHLDRGFAFFETWRDERLEQEEAERHKLDRKIVAEEHWIRYGVTARRKRNMRRVGELAALRRERRDSREKTGLVEMATQAGPVSGALVIEANHLIKSYGSQPLIRDFSIRVKRGDRIGFVGANGAGKTTLINMLIGETAADAGVIKLGAQVVLASLDQRRASLPPTTTLVDALTGGGSEFVTVGGLRKHVIGYLKDFLFAPEQARTPIERLSGGERGRLMVARALTLPSNLLVLDEPTNDLDIETLDLLQELLADYAGTVLLVSHDRDFMDKVVTSIVVSESDGRWVEYAGGYSDMVAQRGFGLVPPDFGREKQERSALKQRPGTPKPVAKRKLSFNDQRALATLPDRIQKIGDWLMKLEDQLADGGFHARDPKGFLEASNKHAALKSELTALEEEWLRLEILREQIEGSKTL